MSESLKENIDRKLLNFKIASTKAAESPRINFQDLGESDESSSRSVKSEEKRTNSIKSTSSKRDEITFKRGGAWSVYWLQSLFDADNMRLGHRDEKYCRSLLWLDKKGGLKSLESQLNTHRYKGLIDKNYAENSFLKAIEDKLQSVSCVDYVQKFDDEREPEYIKS